MYTQTEKPAQKTSRAVANQTDPSSQMKSKVKQSFTYANNRTDTISQKKTQNIINKSPIAKKKTVQCYIRAGYIPQGGGFGLDYTNAYNVQNPDGGLDFSQPRKIDEVNKNYATANPPAFPAINPQVSDASGNGLVYIDDSSKLTPEVDHIVERRNGGSNDLRNARVVSKKENNDGTPPRAANYDIVTGNRVELAEVKYDQPNNQYNLTGKSHTIPNKGLIDNLGLSYLLAVNQKCDAGNINVGNFNYSLNHLNLIRNLNNKEINTNAPVDKKDYIAIKSIS